jgi:hypothetical protein
VQKANDRGITVWMCPAYLGYGGGDEGWFREMKAAGRASLRGYGQFVGRRFKDLPNIVWVLGGDFTPSGADKCATKRGGAVVLASGQVVRDTAAIPAVSKAILDATPSGEGIRAVVA